MINFIPIYLVINAFSLLFFVSKAEWFIDAIKKEKPFTVLHLITSIIFLPAVSLIYALLLMFYVIMKVETTTVFKKIKAILNKKLF